MILSDRDIKDRISSNDPNSLNIEPFDESNVEPASVDLTIGSDATIVQRSPTWRGIAEVGVDGNNALKYRDLKTDGVMVRPGDLILGTTKERIEMPDDLSAKVSGRSTVGRIGVSVHQTAGFIDPCFRGEITLEITNTGPVPWMFSEGQRVCQIIFKELSSPAEQCYGHEGSQYQDQSGATKSGMKFD